MADLVAHIQQARHNEDCASFLLANNQGARDWAITAAFYSAVHLVEACFSTVGTIGHSDHAQDTRGGEDPHEYRQRKVLELASSCYNSYRKLRLASYHVRYLPASAPGGSLFALHYYDIKAARYLVETDLPSIRAELERSFDVKLH